VFATATVAWAEQFRAAIKAKTGGKMRLVINFSASPVSGNGGASPLVLRMCNATDGVLDEFGWINIQTMLPGGVEGWLDKLRWMENLQKHGVSYYSNNYVVGNVSSQLPRGDVEWALASYLMGAGQTSALLVTPWNDAHVGNWSHRPELAAIVGTPLGAGAAVGGTAVFCRNFSSAVAFVNPGTQRASVHLDKHYRYTELLPLSGTVEPTAPLILTAQSGRVLLRVKNDATTPHKLDDRSAGPSRGG
jgi:hypothetical protein